jgi:hypothetical protein
LDKIGLVNSIITATASIDSGRKGFAIIGKEREGRIAYETGIAIALSVFKEVQTSADPQTMLLAEYTFVFQELQFCETADKDTINSLTKAIQSFDDAFLAIKSVDEPEYKIADTIFPHISKYRVKGFPNDSFHIACIAHRTRLRNILRSPGIDPIEKALLKQRFTNLSAAQNGYIEKQKLAIIN